MTSACEMIDGIPTYNLYIGGQWTAASRNEAATSYNPATGELYARVHQAGAVETERAVAAAHEAFKAWADTVVSEREAVFLRAVDVLAAKAKEITDVLIEESGSVAGKAGLRSRLLLRSFADGRGRDATLPGRNDADDAAGTVRLHGSTAARRHRRYRAVQCPVPTGDEKGRHGARGWKRLRAEAIGAHTGDRIEDRGGLRRGASAGRSAQRHSWAGGGSGQSACSPIRAYA